jgi:hypothetical protein
VNYSLTYDLTNKRWEVEDLTWIDGIYLVQVFFNDSVGNEAYSQEWFSVDTTAPEVTIEYPANTTYTTSFIDTYATNTSFVYKGWYRYRNGSWSDNYSLVYNSENTRWESGGLSWIDGSYCIQVFFNDSFGNEAFDEEWFTVDTTPPFVTISSPINITYTTVRVNIYATNDTHVDTAWYRFKNGSWSINYSLTFDFYDNRWETEEMIWIDGYYLVQVFFNDTVGNEAYSQEWFSIDTTAPEVSIVNLVNTTYTISFIDIYAVNTTFVHKGWYRYRNGSWSKNYSLIYNSENTRWESGSLIWIDGSYCIQVFFNDSFGNEAYDEEWFTIDTTAPLVTITNPNNTTYTTISVAIYATNSSVVHKAWTRYKNGSWSENYSLTYDSFDERWELEFLSWIDGIYLIQVFFNDSVGNEDYNEEWLTVDTTAPKVTISSPGNITYAITIVKIYASNDTNVEKAWARFKNSSWSTNFTMIYDPIDVRWEVEHLKFNNGSYLIQVFFIDSVGNEDHSSVTFTVYVDILPPTITLKTLNNGSVLTSNTPIVILVTDFNLDKVIINWDGGVNLTLPSPYETILPQLETEHVLFVYAIDTSNNSIIKRFVFITDDTSPDISLETITYSAVGLNIADDNLNTVLYSWDNNDYKILDIPHQAELPPLDGNYTLYIYANDSAGNMASEFFNILVDRVSPVIELLSPKNGSVLHSSAEIMFNVTDEQLDSILFNWDRTTNNSIFLPYMAKLPEGEGNHFLYIFANDSVGLWSQAVFVFTTDDVRPEIKLRDHLNMSTLPPNTNISLIISDANLDAVLYNWDDSQEGILFEFTTVLPKEEGKHILYVFANDTAGNWATVQFILYTSAKTTKSSSELESSQGSSSSDETDGLINTQAILIPGGFSIGILLSILFVSFGIIASRLIRRRFSSD